MIPAGIHYSGMRVVRPQAAGSRSGLSVVAGTTERLLRQAGIHEGRGMRGLGSVGDWDAAWADTRGSKNWDASAPTKTTTTGTVSATTDWGAIAGAGASIFGTLFGAISGGSSQSAPQVTDPGGANDAMAQIFAQQAASQNQTLSMLQQQQMQQAQAQAAAEAARSRQTMFVVGGVGLAAVVLVLVLKK